MTEQEHLYVKVMEECAEVIERASKLLQYGHFESETSDSGTNEQRLRHEILDLLTTIENLYSLDGLERPSPSMIDWHMKMKREKISKYLKYSIELGRVTR